MTFSLLFVLLTGIWNYEHDVAGHLEDYNNYNLNRWSKRGSGVSAFVHSRIVRIVLEEVTLATYDFEILTLKNCGTIFSVLYRAPSRDKRACTERWGRTKKQHALNKKLITMQ